MDLQSSLKDLGLTERESIVYTTLLQIGEGSILDISKNCAIKRPTIYTAVESLMAKGLVNQVNIGKRAHFRPEPPEKLNILLKIQERTLQNILPQLLALQNVPRGTKPEIRFYDGKEAVSAFYRSLFASMDEKDEICFISSMRDLQTSFSEELEIFLKTAKRWKIRSKELYPDNAASRNFIEGAKRLPQQQKIRLLPKGVDLFYMELFFTKDILGFISFRSGIFAISIKSPHFVESFRSLFQTLWHISKEPEN